MALSANDALTTQNPTETLLVSTPEEAVPDVERRIQTGQATELQKWQIIKPVDLYVQSSMITSGFCFHKLRQKSKLQKTRSIGPSRLPFFR